MIHSLYKHEYAPQFLSTPIAFYVILKNMNYIVDASAVQATIHDAVHDTVHDGDKETKMKSLLEFCVVARSRDEIQTYLGISNRGHLRTAYLKPLLDSGKLKMTLPDKPSSHNQKYVKT